jgi:hypothetical protein
LDPYCPVQAQEVLESLKEETLAICSELVSAEERTYTYNYYYMDTVHSIMEQLRQAIPAQQAGARAAIVGALVQGDSQRVQEEVKVGCSMVHIWRS